MLDSIKEHTGYDLTGMNEEQIREVCQKLNMEIDDTMGKGKLIDEIFGEFCKVLTSSRLSSPTIRKKCLR